MIPASLLFLACSGTADRQPLPGSVVNTEATAHAEPGGASLLTPAAMDPMALLAALPAPRSPLSRAQPGFQRFADLRPADPGLAAVITLLRQRWPELPAVLPPRGVVTVPEQTWWEQAEVVERGEVTAGVWRLWWCTGEDRWEGFEVQPARAVVRRVYHGPQGGRGWPFWMGLSVEEQRRLAQDVDLGWQALQHAQWTWRRAALLQLAEQRGAAASDPRLEAALLEASRDVHPRVREAAVVGMAIYRARLTRGGRKPAPVAYTALPAGWLERLLALEAAADDDPVFHELVLWALASVKDGTALAQLQALLCDPDPAFRALALLGLGPYLDRVALEPLLLDPEPQVAAAAAEAWAARSSGDLAQDLADWQVVARAEGLHDPITPLLYWPRGRVAPVLEAWRQQHPEDGQIRSLVDEVTGEKGTYSLQHLAVDCESPLRERALGWLAELGQDLEVQKAACPGWPALGAGLSSGPTCANTLEPSYSVQLWSPALAQGPVQVSLRAEDGALLDQGSLPADGTWMGTLVLHPGRSPRTLTLRQGELQTEQPVPLGRGAVVAGLCQVEAPAPDAMQAWPSVVVQAWSSDAGCLALGLSLTERMASQQVGRFYQAMDEQAAERLRGAYFSSTSRSLDEKSQLARLWLRSWPNRADCATPARELLAYGLTFADEQERWVRKCYYQQAAVYEEVIAAVEAGTAPVKLLNPVPKDLAEADRERLRLLGLDAQP